MCGLEFTTSYGKQCARGIISTISRHLDRNATLRGSSKANTTTPPSILTPDILYSTLLLRRKIHFRLFRLGNTIRLL